MRGERCYWTHQTELDTVEDPLDGEAGQENERGEKYQTEIETAGLQGGTSHHHLRLEMTEEEDEDDFQPRDPPSPHLTSGRVFPASSA